ncbi:hypothetical protein A3709_22375, partial [Halioglobus sp. HI00S01]|uniref:hypothetical protein n=1 Tax=Halioglobus sp. HI00S01 TaxID=1822214 RepID=UPI0007C3AE2F
TLIIKLEDGTDLELHAYLQLVKSMRVGFKVQHVDRENIDPRSPLLEQHMDPTAPQKNHARLD